MFYLLVKGKKVIPFDYILNIGDDREKYLLHQLFFYSNVVEQYDLEGMRQAANFCAFLLKEKSS